VPCSPHPAACADMRCRSELVDRRELTQPPAELITFHDFLPVFFVLSMSSPTCRDSRIHMIDSSRAPFGLALPLLLVILDHPLGP